MRILFVVPYFPSLIRVRPHNLIRQLHSRGHEVVVLTTWTEEKERLEAEELRRHSSELIAPHLATWRSLWNCMLALPSEVPLQSVYSWNPEALARCQLVTHGGKNHRKFDIVHVEHLRGARYGLAIKSSLSRCNSGAPIIWDSVDCISQLFRQAAKEGSSRLGRWLTGFELRRTERYEGWLLGQFDKVLVTSVVDKAALQSLVPRASNPGGIAVLPNGVDLDYFGPNGRLPRSPASLVLSGKMSYHANVTMAVRFVAEVLPQIWARRPDVELWIVGKDPTREVRSLARHPRIIVTGTVPDMRPYLQTATLAVAPLVYGAGIQNKILESMGCATPVVATPQAVSALDTVSGQDLLVAQGAEEFAKVVLGMLENPSLRKQVGEAGRRYVETHHDWARITDQLEEVYDDAIRSAS